MQNIIPRVLANSLPKSGTHLLTQLLNALGMRNHPFHLTGALGRVQGRNPFRRWQIRRRHDRKGIRIDIDNDIKIDRDWLASNLADVPYGSYIRGHCPYSKEIENLLHKLDYKILFIIRDPRDVVVSYFHHMVRDKNYPPHSFFVQLPTDDERLKYAITGIRHLDTPRLYRAPIDFELESVIGWIDSTNVCAVRFESLIGPQGGGEKHTQIQTVQRIMDFLGINYDSQQVEKIAARVFSPSSPTFRKGRIGDWKNHFSEANKRLFNQIAGDYLVRLGYESEVDGDV